MTPLKLLGKVTGHCGKAIYPGGTPSWYLPGEVLGERGRPGSGGPGAWVSGLTSNARSRSQGGLSKGWEEEFVGDAPLQSPGWSSSPQKGPRKHLGLPVTSKGRFQPIPRARVLWDRTPHRLVTNWKLNRLVLPTESPINTDLGQESAHGPEAKALVSCAAGTGPRLPRAPRPLSHGGSGGVGGGCVARRPEMFTEVC